MKLLFLLVSLFITVSSRVTRVPILGGDDNSLRWPDIIQDGDSDRASLFTEIFGQKSSKLLTRVKRTDATRISPLSGGDGDGGIPKNSKINDHHKIHFLDKQPKNIDHFHTHMRSYTDPLKPKEDNTIYPPDKKFEDNVKKFSKDLKKHPEHYKLKEGTNVIVNADGSDVIIKGTKTAEAHHAYTVDGQSDYNIVKVKGKVTPKFVPTLKGDSITIHSTTNTRDSIKKKMGSKGSPAARSCPISRRRRRRRSVGGCQGDKPSDGAVKNNVKKDGHHHHHGHHKLSSGRLNSIKKSMGHHKGHHHHSTKGGGHHHKKTAHHHHQSSKGQHESKDHHKKESHHHHKTSSGHHKAGGHHASQAGHHKQGGHHRPSTPHHKKVGHHTSSSSGGGGHHPKQTLSHHHKAPVHHKSGGNHHHAGPTTAHHKVDKGHHHQTSMHHHNNNKGAAHHHSKGGHHGKKH